MRVEAVRCGRAELRGKCLFDMALLPLFEVVWLVLLLDLSIDS